MLHFYKPPIFGDEIVLRSVDWLEKFPWHENEVNAQNDKFEVNLQVKNFTPEEIKVKIVGDFIVIEAKQEEKKDAHGFISREFVRKYKLPLGCQSDKVKSTLSADGMLNIVVPREAVVLKDTIIPVTHDEPKPKSKL